MLPPSLLLLIAACQPTTAPVTPPPPSLVLVTLDTTRADRLGAYGYEAARTPTIDRLAAEGVRFERAYATVPLTTPSHASIMTGLYPPRHGVRNNGDATLAPEAVTLAEHLSARGYQTAAATSAFVTTRLWGLDQGFGDYFDDIQAGRPGNRWAQERPAGPVVDDLTGWLSQREDGAPFFLWAHFYDAHHPYKPPPPFDEALEEPYDGELAYIDAQLARLVAAAEESAGPGGVAFVIVADHGEALEREHGEIMHGMYVFDTTMRVPFIFRPPTPLPDPVVIDATTASIADVLPTALGLLGLPVVDDVDGVDLSGAVSGPVERAAVYMESLTPQQRFGFHPEIATAQGDHKLFDTPSPLLVNTTTDPGERRNLIAEPDQAERIEALREAAQRAWASSPLQTGGQVAPEVLEQLAMLGYVNNDFEHSGQGEVDAKDRADLIGKIEGIRELRDPVAVEVAYRALLEEAPDIGEARMGLAQALSAQGREAEAEVVFRDALAVQPTSTVLRVNLAHTLAALDRHEEGLAEMLAVLEQVPGDNIAQIGVLRMMTDLGRVDEGIRYGTRWLSEKPDDAGLKAHLGVLYGKQGDLERAEPLLRESLTDDVPRQLVHKLLASIALGRGEVEEALRHLRSEQQLLYQPDLYDDTARLLFSMQRWAEAADDFAVYSEAQPGDHDARREHAQAVYNTYDYELAAEILAPALAARPDDPDVLLLHANILAKIGDREEAEAAAARANALHRERLEAAGAVIVPEAEAEP